MAGFQLNLEDSIQDYDSAVQASSGETSSDQKTYVPGKKTRVEKKKQTRRQLDKMVAEIARNTNYNELEVVAALAEVKRRRDKIIEAEMKKLELAQIQQEAMRTAGYTNEEDRTVKNLAKKVKEFKERVISREEIIFMASQIKDNPEYLSDFKKNEELEASSKIWPSSFSKFVKRYVYLDNLLQKGKSYGDVFLPQNRRIVMKITPFGVNDNNNTQSLVEFSNTESYGVKVSFHPYSTILEVTLWVKSLPFWLSYYDILFNLPLNYTSTLIIMTFNNYGVLNVNGRDVSHSNFIFSPDIGKFTLYCSNLVDQSAIANVTYISIEEMKRIPDLLADSNTTFPVVYNGDNILSWANPLGAIDLPSVYTIKFNITPVDYCKWWSSIIRITQTPHVKVGPASQILNVQFPPQLANIWVGISGQLNISSGSSWSDVNAKSSLALRFMNQVVISVSVRKLLVTINGSLILSRNIEDQPITGRSIIFCSDIFDVSAYAIIPYLEVLNE